MKLTVSKSYVDKEGRVMAVTMPVPVEPDPEDYVDMFYDAKGYQAAYDSYLSAIQQVKDTSVVYEDQKSASKQIYRLHRKIDIYEKEHFDIQPDTFYDHDTVEVEIGPKCRYRHGSHSCPHDCLCESVARILPIVEHYIVEPDTMVVEKPEQSDWDTVLTDAIVATDGCIKSYSKILKYLSDNYTITRKE
jgi:hypothetical protein